MAQYPHEILWRFPFDKSGSNAIQGSANTLNEADDGRSYTGRAVSIRNGKAVFSANNERIAGAFQYFNSGLAVVKVGSVGVKYKKAINQPLNTGQPIVGAERVIQSGQPAQPGFVKNPTEVSPTQTIGATSEAQTYIRELAIQVRGIGLVTNGGGTHAANTDPPADVVVMHGPAASLSR